MCEWTCCTGLERLWPVQPERKGPGEVWSLRRCLLAAQRGGELKFPAGAAGSGSSAACRRSQLRLRPVLRGRAAARRYPRGSRAWAPPPRRLISRRGRCGGGARRCGCARGTLPSRPRPGPGGAGAGGRWSRALSVAGRGGGGAGRACLLLPRGRAGRESPRRGLGAVPCPGIPAVQRSAAWQAARGAVRVGVSSATAEEPVGIQDWKTVSCPAREQLTPCPRVFPTPL